MRISMVAGDHANGLPQPVPASGPRPMTFFLQMMATLSKVRVSALITFTAVGGALVAAGDRISLAQLGWLVFSVGLTCAGAGALNHYLDRDIDAKMKRTRQRPLPAGHIPQPWIVPIGGTALVAVGLFSAARFLNPTVALYGLAGVAIYVGVYTIWLKRRTPWNIVIGGLAGGTAVLAGGAIVPEGRAFAVIALAAVVFLWTPPHFWSLAIAYEDDYRKAGVPMLPVVVGRQRTGWAILGSTLLLIPVSLIPAFWAPLGRPFLLVAMVGGGLLLSVNIRLVRHPSRREALTNFHLSNLYLLLLFLAAMLSVWPGIM